MRCASLIKPSVLLASLSLVAAQSDAVRADGQCPDHHYGFRMLVSNHATCPIDKNGGDPIEVQAECYTGYGGVTCEVYPQEYESSGNLLYQWTIRVGNAQTVYPIGTNPFVSFDCAARQNASATITVWNGSAWGTDFVGMSCGQQQ